MPAVQLARASRSSFDDRRIKTSPAAQAMVANSIDPRTKLWESTLSS
jgi:hypothetical protein